MSIIELYEIFTKHPKISTDSRRIEKDSLFFALKGENFNGNTYATTALENGAAYSIVDEAAWQLDERYILVENVLTTLQQLATYHRLQIDIPIIAITGTNGKTTTKELVTEVLSKNFRVDCTKGNLNNHIGVPLTLLSMSASTQIGVVEMGANHPGDIVELCEIALPNLGLITNVGMAHLEGFGSFEGVKQTKAELYRFIEETGGKIFLNTANSHLREMAGNLADRISYKTLSEGEGIEGELIQSAPLMVFQVKFPKGWLYIKTNLAGGYNLENALAAVCIGNYFGVSPFEIVEAIEAYKPTNNRSQFVKTAKNQLLMDAYNANPTSMNAALENFTAFDAPLKGVILGDMLELGEASHEEHQKIADKLTGLNLDLVLLTGKEFAKCQTPSNFIIFDDNSLLINYLENEKPQGYLFLIKGSRGMKLETVADKL
ncbi:MAG: UDP-N-acetylmuramoyl-tripeptide--D-alanyl-D-alanine ligase [Mariniphaga sp.]|nr:UDP-N-acetylmuramoyl-tripeptide--D-alanyl-D-alanine ligase [Mariniphaga sp.]